MPAAALAAGPPAARDLALVPAAPEQRLQCPAAEDLQWEAVHAWLASLASGYGGMEEWARQDLMRLAADGLVHGPVLPQQAAALTSLVARWQSPASVLIAAVQGIDRLALLAERAVAARRGAPPTAVGGELLAPSSDQPSAGGTSGSGGAAPGGARSRQPRLTPRGGGQGTGGSGSLVAASLTSDAGAL